MIPLYALFLNGLKVLSWYVTRRANKLERQYSDAALQAEEAVQPMSVRPGNAQKADALTVAKAQYKAGQLVMERDELEASFLKWHSRSENLAHFVEKLRSVKGRFLPYFLGMIDLGLVLVAAHYLGLPHGLNENNVRAWLEKFRG